MNFRFTPEQEDFRNTFISWLEKNLPEDWDPSRYRNYEDQEKWEKAYKDFQKRLFDAGYAGISVPKEYGGQGRTITEDIIVAQKLAATCMELRLPGLITHGMAVPTIMTCGSEEHKKTLLPKILDGTHIWSRDSVSRMPAQTSPMSPLSP